MSNKSAELAQAFNERATTFAEVARGLNDDQWNAACDAEGWSVGTTVHHVGQGLESTFGFTNLIITGEVPPVTMDDIDAANAAHAEEHAHPDRAATIEMIESATSTVTQGIAALSDEDLEKSAVVPGIGDDPVSVQGWIEMIVIGHIGMHQSSIESAAAQ